MYKQKSLTQNMAVISVVARGCGKIYGTVINSSLIKDDSLRIFKVT